LFKSVVGGNALGLEDVRKIISSLEAKRQFRQAAFSKHFRTITYSRRYHWPNQPIPDDCDYSMLLHVDE
jgi:hypothetical protein